MIITTTKTQVITWTLLLIAACSANATDTSKKFDPRDFSGNWERATLVVTYSNVPGSDKARSGRDLPEEIEIKEAPFTSKGRQMFENNHPGYGPRVSLERNDPVGRCLPMGLPRELNVEVLEPHHTFEMVQMQDRIFQFFEYRHGWREIWMDGRELPALEDTWPTWNGFSVGRMEGDTLVVESVGFDERTWLDKFGYPHSDQMKLVERYRRLDADTLELRMIVIDPVVYSEPFLSDVKIYKINREKYHDWDEQIHCIPEEEFNYQQLMGTGNLIE